MKGENKGASVLRTVLFSTVGAFAAPLALSALLRIFYCYVCNHMYTIQQSSADIIWFVSDVLAELGVFFGIGVFIAGTAQKLRLAWLAIPVTVLYAAVCPMLLYTIEYSSGVFANEEDAASALMSATGALEAYLIYILISLVTLFVFITVHASRENAGKARLGFTAPLLSPRFLPAAIGYSVSAVLLAVVIVSSVAVGNGFGAFMLSILIAVLRAVFVFLGMLAAGRGGKKEGTA